MHGSVFNFGRFYRAAMHSFMGLGDAFLSEATVRQHLIMILVLAPTAVWLGENGVERAIMIGSLFLILIMEVVNTAIETTIDRVGAEIHDLSRKAKDVGAAAVMLSIVTAVVVWVLVLLD